jgi:hypothetical protein
MAEMETDECLNNNGGCWRDEKTNITACKDTFRGRICQCPVVDGVQYQGDGYTHCKGCTRLLLMFHLQFSVLQRIISFQLILHLNMAEFPTDVSAPLQSFQRSDQGGAR